MITQELGFASHDDVEEVCLAVHPCFRTYCDCVVVCQRGGTFAGPVRGVDFLGTGTCTDTCAFSGTWILAGTCTFAGTSTPKASMMQRMKREEDCLFNSAYGKAVAGGIPPTRASAGKHDFVQDMILPDARRNLDYLR